MDWRIHMRTIVNWDTPTFTVTGKLGKFSVSLKSVTEPQPYYWLKVERYEPQSSLYWSETIEDCETLDEALEEAERRVSAMLSDWQEALDEVAFGWVEEAVNG